MSADQQTLVTELAALANQLAAIMEQETAHLEANRNDALAALGPDKSRLSLRYDELMARVATVPAAELRADPGFADLSAAASRLDRAARINAFRLSIHIKANQRVASIIAQAARSRPRRWSHMATAGPALVRACGMQRPLSPYPGSCKENR
jgi:flagellar biosynthesis/type III secretory pathway chaperone